MCLIKKIAYLLSVMLLSSSSSVFGFSINPMFLDMKPNGSQARATVTVQNSSPKPMPVRASVSELTLDINGSPKSVPNNKDFIIFPPQAVLKPYGRQTFRVQWRGRPNLPKGKVYEVTVGQVLAKDKRKQDVANGLSLNVGIAVAFSTVVNMRAAVGSPKPIVKASRLVSNQLGKTLLDTVIENKGNQNFLMIQADSVVTVFDAQNRRLWTQTFSPNDMMINFGLGVVQPHKSRRMKIPLLNFPRHLVAKAKRASLEVRPSAE